MAGKDGEKVFPYACGFRFRLRRQHDIESRCGCTDVRTRNWSERDNHGVTLAFIANSSQHVVGLIARLALEIALGGEILSAGGPHFEVNVAGAAGVQAGLD